MKYPCNMIQDLLPLYHDGVCSQESREIIESHFAECPACKEYYAMMCEADEIIPQPHEENIEQEKVASFQSVSRRLKKRQIVAAALGATVFLLIIIVGIEILKNYSEVVPYSNNISVSMLDKGLVAQLHGSVWNEARSATVSVQKDGQEQTYLFFYLTDSKWDDLITSSTAFTEYTLCPADKGANLIDCVFYYTGSYTNIDMMEYNELEQIIQNSTLLWEK